MFTIGEVSTIGGNKMKWYFLNNIYGAINNVIGALFTSHAEVINNVTTNQPTWRGYQDLEINTAMFEKGIVVIKPYGKLINTDGTSFDIGSRKLVFSQEALIMTQGSKAASALTKTKLLLNQLKEYFEESNSFTQNNDFIIINSTRREEIFLSLSIRSGSQNLGFYVYPWLSTNNTNDIKNFSFHGFKRFITAGCMFGSALKGMDQLETRLDLIKHDIKFHPRQKITTLDFNQKASNPYEAVIFNEFKKLMLLIDNLSDTDDDTPKQLSYHLPYYDYMLFGIELFVRGRMTLSALDQFFKVIILKKNEYTITINAICAEHNVECTIESPFENLFGEIPTNNITETILSKLELSTEEPNNQLTSEQERAEQELKEQALVHHCLKKLQINEFNQKHQQVWQDFIEVVGINKINTLEDLFKMANATMILLACKTEQNYETCSLLPLSEKQIQVSYAKFKESRTDYPAVFNITTIDPVISYDLISKPGLLFYFGCCQDSLNKLVKHDILTQAHKNVALTGQTSVEDMLASLKIG